MPRITNEISASSLLTGLMLGLLFGIGNIYLGLRIGFTVGASIPIAVVSIAILKSLSSSSGDKSIIDSNIAQSTGTASSALASGLVFTIPVIYLWEIVPSITYLIAISLCGGFLSLFVLIPLRKQLIENNRENLIFPEGTASAQVLIGLHSGGNKAKLVSMGMVISFFQKIATGFFNLLPERFLTPVSVGSSIQVGFELSPAMYSVGYIVGYRTAATVFAGGLVTWLGLIPMVKFFGGQLAPLHEANTISSMPPIEIWSKYIRYIGAGAVTGAGIITVGKSAKTMLKALASIFTIPLKDKINIPQEKKDISSSTLLFLFSAFAALSLFVLNSTSSDDYDGALYTVTVSFALMLILGAIFIFVSARIVGLIGVSANPLSGMTIVSLMVICLIFLMFNWISQTDKIVILTIGAVVCIASGLSGNFAQDYKAGSIIGTKPRNQEIVQIIGIAIASFVIPVAVWLFGETFKFGTTEFAVPQAILMKTVIEGVLQSEMPWMLLLIGCTFSVVVEILGVSSIPFAIGLYLPIFSTMPIFLGGCTKRYLEDKNSRGLLYSAGLIAGEALATVCISISMICFGALDFGFDTLLSSSVMNYSAAGLFVMIVIIQYFVVMKNKKS